MVSFCRCIFLPQCVFYAYDLSQFGRATFKRPEPCVADECPPGWTAQSQHKGRRLSPHGVSEALQHRPEVWTTGASGRGSRQEGGPSFLTQPRPVGLTPPAAAKEAAGFPALDPVGSLILRVAICISWITSEVK